jgi:hypothetical protein
MNSRGFEKVETEYLKPETNNIPVNSDIGSRNSGASEGNKESILEPLNLELHIG